MRGARVRLVADSRGNRLLVKGDIKARKRIRELHNLPLIVYRVYG